MDAREKEFYELMSAHKRAMKIKTCFHHHKDKCQGKIKQAHSIQRNGRLSIIEGEVNGNKCIYTFTSHKISERSALEDLVPIGKKEASTFFGFCDYHDTLLFSAIENFEFDSSDKHCFLHSYCSFAHSYHRKNEELQGYSDPDSDFVKRLPKVQIQSMLEGAKMGLNDLAPYKRDLNRMIENEIYDELEYLVYEKEGLFPIAVSSLMSPNVSYKNHSMNNHIDPEKPFSQPIITFLPDKNKTILIIAAFPDDKKSIRLLDELDQLSDYHLEKAITSLIIANCENTFFSPLFWNSLTKIEKRAFLDEFLDNTMNPKYIDRFFISNFNFFSPKYEIKRLIN
jgi:hypothetical protein